MKRIILNIGDIVVSEKPAVLETVLGSCVAVCLWDEELGIGGMNHFMIPNVIDGIKNPLYCGSESIQSLISRFIKIGVDVCNLQAKVFGGGKVIREFGDRLDIGRDNVRIAKEILGGYGIPIIREFTRPDYGIKVIFYSATGRVFVKKLQDTEDDNRQ
jgi:chemotaxis protein CheD